MRTQGLWLLLAWATLMPLTGCGGTYLLQGKAVRGEFSSVSFVSPNDTRLQAEGVPTVTLYVFRDPQSLGRKMVATGTSDGTGSFVLPLNEFGTGWMIEDWLIHTYRPGYQSAQSILTFPSKDQNLVLLVTLGPGVAERPRNSDDLWEQFKQFK